MEELVSTERLLDILGTFKDKSGVWNTLLVTEDGLVIASDDITQVMGNIQQMGYLENIGAITAGALSMAEQAIKLIDENKELQQLIIHAAASSPYASDSFSIVLTLLQSNIILLVIYPSVLNLGMILYEIEQVKEQIITYMKEDEFVLHEESVL